jgi:hypothetical protein
MKVAAALLLMAAVAAAQEPGPVERLRAQIAAAPPEIGADLLLRMVEKRLVGAPKGVAELLEQAWHLAGEARLQMPRRTIQRSTGALRGTELNTLSLRLRVLRQLRDFDRGMAVEWMRGMAAPVPEAAECGSQWVWDLGPWYEAIDLLGTLEDRARAVREITHPSQLAPALELVLGYQGRGEERGMLATWWAGSLAAVRGDSVSFEDTRELPVRMAVVAEKLRAEGESAAYLADAWRTYMLAHWQGEVCQQYASPVNRQAWRMRTEAAYNQRLREAAASDAPEIDFDEEAEPRRVIPFEARRDEEMRTRSEEWAALSGSVRKVVPALGPEASDGEVRRAVLDLLERLGEWSEPVEGFTLEQWLQMRVTAVAPLLTQVDDDTRRDVIRWRLALLRDSELQRTVPGAWLEAWRQVLPAASSELVREAGSPLMDLLLAAREILGWQ